MGEIFAGRYELLDPIATGGMGSIWRVLDGADRQVKVAKILRQSDAASLLRFVREQSMRIDHAHVVTPLSWAGMDDRVLFTMPLVRGGSVADVLRDQGALPPRWVATVVDQLLMALEAVHGAGIVHRDVKPGNLLLEATGRAAPHLRLTDFGIAAPVDSPRMTRASVAIGTPGYMPPEQWHGADPDPRADLYAVGRVALEMLTGERPAARPPGPEQPVPEPVLASGLHALIAQATAESLDDRPATATAMRGELAATGLLGGPLAQHETVPVPDRYLTRPVPASVPPPPPPPRLPPPPPPVVPPGAPTGAPTGATVPFAAPALLPTAVDLPRAPAVPAPTSAGGSPVAGLLLVLLGLVGLVVAAVLVSGS